MVDPVIEICANSVESCIAAQKAGAARVELCAGIPEGGTTPSWGMMTAARKAIDIKFNVIIRPRGGDFLYDDLETEIMHGDIHAARQARADGVVFGCLTADGDIDIKKNNLLMQGASGMSTTFHRAFDVCRDPFRALEEIIDMGFDRILTSGQQNLAMEGRELIARLVEKAAGRIIIMPGSGVNEHNIAELASVTKAHEFHTSARETVSSRMQYRGNPVSMGGTVTIDEFSRQVTSADKVRQIIDILKSNG